MQRSKRKLLSFLVSTISLTSFQLVLADTAENRLSHKEVQPAVEYTASLGICSNSTLLELSNIDQSSCETRLLNFSSVCWNQLDGLGLNYELAKDDTGKELFIAISIAYESCVRSELLRKTVREKHDSDCCENR